MFLLDESLFRLWKDGLVEKEEVLLRSPKAAELAARIAAAERGLEEDAEFEADDEEYEEEDEEEDDEEDEPPRRGRPRR
jgi:twitching motility protein PilT